MSSRVHGSSDKSNIHIPINTTLVSRKQTAQPVNTPHLDNPEFIKEKERKTEPKNPEDAVQKFSPSSPEQPQEADKNKTQLQQQPELRTKSQLQQPQADILTKIKTLSSYGFDFNKIALSAPNRPPKTPPIQPRLKVSIPPRNRLQQRIDQRREETLTKKLETKVNQSSTTASDAPDSGNSGDNSNWAVQAGAKLVAERNKNRRSLQQFPLKLSPLKPKVLRKPLVANPWQERINTPIIQTRVPNIQAKCAACEVEEQQEEVQGDLPEVQRMTALGSDDEGEDANVVQQMPAFESDEAPVQTKLTIGQPGDKYEQEADAIADQVMTMPEPGATGVGNSSKTVDIKRFYLSSSQSLQQKPLEENNTLQAKKQNSQAASATPTLETRLNASKGRGEPLPKDTRNFMETRFGQDFSAVRVHRGSEAVQMNQDLGAQAFTHKQDVYFGAGKYRPESGGGKRLLAHELTHVVQQNGSQLRRARTIQQGANVSLKRKKLSKTDQPTVQRGILGDVWDATGGRVVSGARYVGGRVADAFMWIYHEIEGLVTGGIDWIKNRWNALKSLANGGLRAIKIIFNHVVQFVKSPLSFLSNAIMNMDVESIRQSWGSFTQLVLKVWDNFHKRGMRLLNTVGALWKTLSNFATNAFNRVAELTKHWAFKKLPSSIRKVIYGLIRTLNNLWNKVKSKFDSILNKVTTFVNKAFKTVRDFVKKVLSFAIDKIIVGILQFGKLLVFIKKFLSNPRKYLRPLSQKISGYLKGVEGGFKAQIDKYFGSSNKAVTTTPETETSSTTDVIEKEDDPSATQDSATWSEIGEGVWDIMKKKWEEVKKDPLSIVLNLLLDLVLPNVGNIKDIIKLFQDIKKIVTKPLKAGSLEEFWTSFLHLLDIPILLYNTFWSIVGRTLALPLIIASFIPHPVVKAIAIAAGYALLAALITGELANIGHKLLLLTTGNTTEEEKKDAYNRLADSLIAFAMEVVMAILTLVVAAVGHVVKGVFGFIRGKVFKPKSSSNTPADIDVSSDRKTDVPEGTQHGRPEEVKPPREKSARPVEGETPEILDEKRVVGQEPTADGHNIKITEDGRIYICTTCDEIQIRYAEELKEKTPEVESIKAELDQARKLPNGDEKARAIESIKEKLDTVRAKIRQGETDVPPGSPGSPEHKSQRWQDYQERGGEWEYERWSKVYDENMTRASRAHEIANAYQEQLGWGRREVTVKNIGGTDESRRLDIADTDALKGVEVKSGYITHDADIQSEIRRDKKLIEDGWDIRWHFDGTASKPLLDALGNAKIPWTFRDTSLIPEGYEDHE